MQGFSTTQNSTVPFVTTSTTTEAAATDRTVITVDELVGLGLLVTGFVVSMIL